MTGISRKVRDEAVEALLCCADSRANHTQHATTTHALLGHLTAADYVADSAWKAAFYVLPITVPIADVYLEAAALLRDGWSPGDPVVRR